MKKHYRGKRHMYARRSVAVGRKNKRRRKMAAFIKYLKSGVIQESIKIVARDMASFANDSISDAIEKIRAGLDLDRWIVPDET